MLGELSGTTSTQNGEEVTYSISIVCSNYLKKFLAGDV